MVQNIAMFYFFHSAKEKKFSFNFLVFSLFNGQSTWNQNLHFREGFASCMD